MDEGSQPVRKLMTHRSLLQIATEDATVSSAIEELKAFKHSFLLVRSKEHPEQILGTVSISSLLKSDRKSSLKKIVEPPQWVPDSMEIAELVRYLFNAGNNKACVLDEFGSFCGVFSLSTGINKFLENIFTIDSLPRQGIDTRTRMFSGAQDIADIEEWLPETLKNYISESRTLNGVLTNYIGKIPKTGDRFVIDDWDFYIILANPTRIESVMIRKRNDDEY